MSLARTLFVYCEQLKKGFVTRLTQDQKFEKIYEQVTELFLKETELEVDCIELMDSRPTIDWIVPPFLRVKDLQFEDAVYVQAVLQPRSNEDRRSGIRATATYHRSKGRIKRKSTGKEDEADQEAAEGQAEVAAVSEKRTTGGKDRAKKAKGNEEKAQDVEQLHDSSEAVPTLPPPSRKETLSPVKEPQSAVPPAESSATSEKRLEKTPRKRPSKNAKPKIKVTKHVEPSEKKQRMKQSTLTPSQNAEESHVSVEETMTAAPKETPEKTKRTSLTPVVQEVAQKEVPQPSAAVEKEHGSTSETGTTGSESSSSSEESE